MHKKISDYGIIGNLQSIALVGNDGSIDWLCLPNIDSPSIFGALLDADDGGRFSVSPDGEWDSVMTYLEDSNVLVGKFRTRTGVYTLTDFMDVPSPGKRTLKCKEHALFRLLRVRQGTVRVRIRFEPRFDYGRVIPDLERKPGRGIVAGANGERLVLSTPNELEVCGNHAEGLWELKEGDRVVLHLRYGAEEPDEIAEDDAESLLLDTLEYWRTWLYRSGPGFFNDLGPHRDQVVRSLLVLKLLYYQPYGTMAAAATTSLPERIGGVRNWDYRFSWVRDTSMALTALFQVGHVKETEGYLDWLKKIMLKSGHGRIQVMFRMNGSPELNEEILPHLEGFRGSGPVRIGNNAAFQKQFGIYGHACIAAHLVAVRKGAVDAEMWRGLRLMCDFVIDHWREPDHSIWEMRSEVKHFVHSKVMCWVTLDRCIRIAELTSSEGYPEQWRDTRDAIRRDIETRGWNEMRQAFVLHYETDALDSSTLLMSMSDFLPFDDPRMVATVEAIRAELSEEGFIYRYLTDDGIPGKEGTFLPCTLWLINNLAKQGEIEEAELLLTKVDQAAGPLHLLAEEYDPHWLEQLGNYPQAFSHEAYITAAMAIADARGEQRRKRPPREDLVLPGEQEGRPPCQTPPLAADLADVLDEVTWRYQGGGQIDCFAVGRSPLAGQLGKLLRDVSSMDLDTLRTREEKICFWSNLLNILILYAVPALNIRTSVKEISWFYRRISCRIGEQLFSAEIILHGILRGNRPHPGAFYPPLPPGDPRLSRSIRPSDPRVLFAVWTGAASSAPIAVLRPENLDYELDGAARRFISERALLDMERKKLVLPQIFRWCDDFGRTQHDISVFVAQFAGKEIARKINEYPESFVLDFYDYDWRVCRRAAVP